MKKLRFPYFYYLLPEIKNNQTFNLYQAVFLSLINNIPKTSTKLLKKIASSCLHFKIPF